MENRIKLSLYIKANKPYILRNVFFSVVNENKDLNTLIQKEIEHIRESVIKYNYIECDINLNNVFIDLKKYISDNIFNYSEIKKVLLYDIKHIIPKPKFKNYLIDNIKSQYYINCLMGV